VDGSNPATDWQGLHTVDEVVTVLNPENGWIQNCNSTPFTSAAEFSPKREDYPIYMAPDPENYRGIHAVKILSQARELTLDKLIDLAYDPYLPGFESVVEGLIAAYDQTQDVSKNTKDALDKLRNWDLRVDVNSIPMTLAHFYTVALLEEASISSRFSTDQLEAVATGPNKAQRRTVFENTLETLQNDFGRRDVLWGEVNRYQRLNGDIVQPFNDNEPSLPIGMASGRWGALASFGARQYSGTKKIYGTSGNSFVAVVEFGEKVRAKSMLAGGQSGDSESPHFDDQAQRYADGAFKDVAYYQEDVEKRATRTYHPGE
jgi:acyl-homoserine-lactone acylase